MKTYGINILTLSGECVYFDTRYSNERDARNFFVLVKRKLDYLHATLSREDGSHSYSIAEDDRTVIPVNPIGWDIIAGRPVA